MPPFAFPEKYSIDTPPTVSAKSDFAEYSGSYSLNKGVLHVERRLLIKKAKVPVNAWADYRKFTKTVAEDHDQFIQLQVVNATEAEHPAENREAESLVGQAFQAGQRPDNSAVRDFLARVGPENSRARCSVLFHLHIAQLPICPVSTGNYKEINVLILMAFLLFRKLRRTTLCYGLGQVWIHQS